MGQRPRIDWTSLKALYITGKTADELAVMFDCSADMIRQKSSKEGWKALRNLAKSRDTPSKFQLPLLKNLKRSKQDSETVRSGSEAANSQADAKAEVLDVAFSRAIKLRNSDDFRERVINQADKALATLEKANPTNVLETDRFAEALTKVERIGARAYGYDREGSQPIINIGILGSGSEYDPV